MQIQPRLLGGASKKAPPLCRCVSMLLPLQPELKESGRRVGGFSPLLALKSLKMKICPEQDSNRPPSACETSAFLLRHQAFHTNKNLEVIFKVERRGGGAKEENLQKAPLPLIE